MKLVELLDRARVRGPIPDCEAAGLQYDSRQIGPGEVFFAFPGERADGHQFVEPALAAGAVAVVSERPAPAGREGVWVRVEHGREALAVAALRFYGRPDRRLKLTGVTGTNGKTTTVYLIDSILEAAGAVSARLGTIEHKIGSKRYPAVNTTPESLDVVRFLVELEQQGGTHASLEVSSHALELRRIFGMDFHTAVFTNLTRDHLDFHGDMPSYARAKRRLFEGAGGAVPRFGVINVDDPTGREFAALEGFERLLYGSDPQATVRAENVQVDFSGIRFRLAAPGGKARIVSPLKGEFNVHNVLAAAAAGLSLGIDLEGIQRGIAACPPVPGRFEPVDEGQRFLVIVDYAHTDDALENLIHAARRLSAKSKPPGRILTVFGCGGDRDRTKRPLMGEIAGRLSDHVILTSDNPRSEDPLLIINDIRVGLQRVDAQFETEPDRAQAIRKILVEARRGDVVLIAGKGHETYQRIGDRSVPFDDREVARRVLRELGYGAGADPSTRHEGERGPQDQNV
jgi:UDP-N-acetylmuramoyl-L-alanyl-D-glutamate--2,6-diaminopimelate ligase